MDVQLRQCEPELMDQPELDSAAHHHALSGLSRINWWSRTAGRIWPALKELVVQHDLDKLTILDLACGGGDVALSLARLARADNIAVTLQGWDVSATAAAYASKRAARLGISNVTFFERDALSDVVSRSFDAVICTLFLHHLSETQVVTLLQRMREAARHNVIVDDLLRTRAGYYLAWFGTRILSRSPIVHFDGPVSVQAAFSLKEIEELAEHAGLRGASITRHWPQRFLLNWRCE